MIIGDIAVASSTGGQQGRCKVGFDYGLINLNRFSLNGMTHAFHTRLQWIY